MLADSSPLAQARAYRAHLLIERAAWRTAAEREKFGVLIDADPRLQLPVHAMRAFRASHAAGKLFIAWAAGPQARKLLTGQPGLRAPSGGGDK